MFYEIVDNISYRDTPFDKIQWYAILSMNDNYFFNNFATTEYEPVNSYSFENGDLIPLQGFHIDIFLEVYSISGAKMEKGHYDKLMAIKRHVVRGSKIDKLLDE